MSQPSGMERFLAEALTGSHANTISVRRRLSNSSLCRAAIATIHSRGKEKTLRDSKIPPKSALRLEALLLFADYVTTHQSPRRIMAVQALSEGQKTEWNGWQVSNGKGPRLPLMGIGDRATYCAISKNMQAALKYFSC